jgi:hypothetical protein
MTLHRTLLAVVTFAALSPLVRAQGRTEVTVNDTGLSRISGLPPSTGLRSLLTVLST